MTKFLNDSDFAEIRTAINDTIETFSGKTIYYYLSPSETLSRFGRDKQNATDKTEYALNGLIVWDAPKAELEIDELGKFDFSMGYVLFGWDYLDGEGLIISEDVNGIIEAKPSFLPERDKIKIDGETLEVMGIVVQGQLNDRECVVKVYFKRGLKNGAR